MEHHIFNILAQFGFGGLIFIIWYFDRKQLNQLIEMHKQTLEKLKDEIDANKKNNEDFKEILGDLKEVMFMQIQQLARIEQKINDNQFCPIIREFRREERNEQGEASIKR